MDMRNKITAVLFLLLIAAGAVTHWFVSDRDYSESEKRVLEQFPEVSAKTVFKGEFGKSMETYMSDQFPGRDTFVALKTVSERVLGKKESGGVYFADDDYLMEVFKEFDQEQITKNVKALRSLQDMADEMGIPMLTMLVPTAPQILADKLPKYAPNADQNAVITFAAEKGIKLIDVTDALTEHKKEYIFYRTDHHWTSRGAYYAYVAWKQKKGETAEPLAAFKEQSLSSRFQGTTYAKVNDPTAISDTILAYYKTENHKVSYNNGSYVTDSIYERKYLDGADQYGVFLNSNQPTTVVSGNGAGKLLIIKDSYANCFAQFVVDEYEETHMIDLRFFIQSLSDYIEENGITEILVLYNIPNFAGDSSLPRLVRILGR